MEHFILFFKFSPYSKSYYINTMNRFIVWYLTLPVPLRSYRRIPRTTWEGGRFVVIKFQGPLTGFWHLIYFVTLRHRKLGAPTQVNWRWGSRYNCLHDGVHKKRPVDVGSSLHEGEEVGGSEPGTKDVEWQ